MSIFTDVLGTIKRKFSVGVRGVILSTEADITKLNVFRADGTTHADVSAGGVTATSVTSNGPLTVTTGGATVTGAVAVTGSVTATTQVAGASLKVGSTTLDGTGSYNGTLIMPTTGGSTNQVLTLSTGGQLIWSDKDGNPTATAARWLGESVSFTFSATGTSTIPMPSGAVVKDVQVVVDTLFDASPVITISTPTQTFVASTDIDLSGFAAGSTFLYYPGLPASTASGTITVAVTAAGTTGAARAIITYASPL